MLWKLRQERKMEQDDPTDDISDSALKWTTSSTNKEKIITREELLKKEISTLQECLNNAYKRIVELNDELQNLKNKN
jgi:3-methyladenine DNA glycosylase/8-oxoguanine DNA glycosylase